MSLLFSPRLSFSLSLSFCPAIPSSRRSRCVHRRAVLDIAREIAAFLLPSSVLPFLFSHPVCFSFFMIGLSRCPALLWHFGIDALGGNCLAIGIGKRCTHNDDYRTAGEITGLTSTVLFIVLVRDAYRRCMRRLSIAMKHDRREYRLHVFVCVLASPLSSYPFLLRYIPFILFFFSSFALRFTSFCRPFSLPLFPLDY